MRQAKDMISSELKKAREYEEREGALISADERPAFHLSPRTGWLNDPNGFSYYDGRYHLFYQYHPYSSHWGPMHWGHAVSDDMISWEYLPCAMAPDEDYDGAGCFSGSAVTLPDGRQLLMYTGCEEFDTDEFGRWKQSQCLAVSGGQSADEFIKYEGNPVISGADLPEGGDPYEFRDPYIWQADDGSFRAVAANARKGPVRTDPPAAGSTAHPKKRPPDLDLRGGTQICLFSSDDGFSWTRRSVLFEDDEKIGIMWECPNFFPLADRSMPSGSAYVLIASPMDMELEDADGSIRFPKGNNVCYIVGDYDDESGEFTPRRSAAHERFSRGGRAAYAVYHPLDCGLDFYAPQVMKAPDGRTIMVAWMQDPSTSNLHRAEDHRIFGQMSLPRELSLRNGRMIQRPVKEIEAYRDGRPVYASIELDSGIRSIDGIDGRLLDMEIEISPVSWSDAGSCSLEEFSIRFACGGGHFTELSYRTDSSVVTVDRSRSGQNEDMSARRSIRVRERRGTISLRIILDRWSAEVFINGGEQVISLTFFTPPEAEGVSFRTEGSAIMDIAAYKLKESDRR